MPDIETGQTQHTLEQIDAGISEVEAAKGDYPTLAAALGAKQDQLQFDSVPTENSTNVMLSGGVYPLQNAIANIINMIDIDFKVNYLPPPASGSTVGSEVEFAVNADGSVTATVIATTTTTTGRSFNWYFTCPAGTWVFSTGQAQSGETPAPCFSYLYGSSGIANDYNNQVFTMDADTSIRCYISIRKEVPAGTVLTFYPMICRPELYAVSNRYVPYNAGT